MNLPRLLAVFMLFLLSASWPHIAAAQAAKPNNTIRGAVVQQTGDSLSITLSAQKAPVFSSYLLSFPERLILDFPACRVAKGVRAPEISHALIGQIVLENASDTPGTARLILVILQPIDYRIRFEGSALILDVEPLPGAGLVVADNRDSEAEAARKTEEDRQRQAAAEAARKAEEDHQRQAAAEAARKAEEERQRQAAAEAARKAEEDRQRQAAAEAARKAEEERQRQAAAEAARKAEEDRQRQAAAEAARKAEEERQRQAAAEAARKAEEDRQRQAAAEAARKAEEDRQRQAAAEAARKAEEERQRQAAAVAARKAEEERQRQAAAEAARKAEEERQRQAAAEAARKAEEERQRLAAAEAARKAEEERQRQAAAVAARKAEEERQRQAAAEAARRQTLPVKTVSPAGGAPQAAVSTGPVILKRLGFVKQGQAGVVRLQFTGPVDVSYQWTDSQTVVLSFAGAKITNRMNLLPLYTQAFGTPVMAVRPDFNPAKNLVYLRITLRRHGPFSVVKNGDRLDIVFNAEP